MMDYDHKIDPKANELEVTGVSRSGRVCKKSSKLVDFQSPDDIETKLKKANALKIHTKGFVSSSSLSPNNFQMVPFSPIKAEPELDIPMDDMDILSESDNDANDSNMDSMDSDDDIDIEDMEIHRDLDDDKSEEELVIDSAPRRSIYMTEKSAKYKKILKDGKVVMGKAQRKDKGKRRFTAYMLWAKDIRKQMLTNPELDFGTISKRLGEMWANVPSNQKYNWKRRAKRIANKFKNNRESALATPFVQKYLHLNKNQTTNPTPTVTAGRTKKTPSKHVPETALPPGDPLMKHPSPESPTKNCISHGPGHQKVPGCQPADVAAHLKLLGDSLTIIGERLKEHEGQIAVSGSLSVLLDSLLCSLGPLMCLTTHIPGLEAEDDHLKELFQNTLDNIAYVMPGL